MNEWPDSEAKSQRRSLADKLGHLFQTVRKPGGREYSNEEVAGAIVHDQGISISASYIWYLRTGQRDNPTFKHLTALASFFGVAPGYFFDEDAGRDTETELALIAALRDGGLRGLVLRSAGLSPPSLRALAEVADRMRDLEHLPAPWRGR